MWSTKKFVSRVVLAVMVLAFSLGSSVSAEGMAYREETVKLTVQVDGFNQGVVDLATSLQPGEVLAVKLLSASGTGYQWQLAGEPALVKVTQTVSPQPLAEGKHIPGGPLRESYIIKAGDVPGTETICFTLVRPWEDKGLAGKTLAITVTVQEGK